MVAETKVGKMLDGARGSVAVDRELLIDCLVTFSALILANPAIVEMDLNPLRAFEGRLSALDARVILA